jgi:hypothetical protein
MLQIVVGVLIPIGIAIATAGFAIVGDPRFLHWFPIVLIAGGLVLTVPGAAWVIWYMLTNKGGESESPARYNSAPYQLPAPVTGPSEVAYWRGRPDSLGDKFFGREAKLDEIADAFAGRRIVVLSGGAGYGKSQLAAEYSHRSGLNGFWTTAGPTLEPTLAALAGDLGVDEINRSQEEITRAVSLRLAALPAETLWIVDNLGDISMVNVLAAQAGQVRLLATTRDQRRNQLPPTAGFLFVEVLDPPSAIDLLCSRSNTKPDDPDLPAIAEAVGRLPLALEMLAVRLGEFGQTPHRLLEAINAAPTPVELEAFKKETRGASIPRVEGVFATISGTLTGLPAEVREVIAPLGYVADEPVSAPLLLALTGGDEGVLERVVSECRRSSVLTVVGDSVQVHSLTIAAILATNPQGHEAEALHRSYSRLWEVCQSDPVALRAEVSHYQRILDRSRAVLGDEDSTVLEYANNLAEGYRALGRNEEAVALHEQTLKLREKVLGPEHPDTLRSRSNLAAGYRALDRDKDADEQEGRH